MNSGTGIDTAAQSSTGLLLPEILFGVMHFLRSYVVLSREQQIVLALWTAHTHAIEAADCTPYLQITSATAEAGKTRLLEVLELLVARPWLTGRTSAAALFRKVDAERPTLLLDESDAAFGGVKEYAEGLRAVLNTGYRASGRASICVGAGPDIDVKEFSTFGAKAIAGIGRLTAHHVLIPAGKDDDVADPFNPKKVSSIRLGGIAGRAAHPSNPRQPLNSGPQMIEVSRDGKRVYVTNSLYTPWGSQFYRDGIRGWMAKLNVDPRGGMALDPDFFLDSGEMRPHQVRLQGGDASSDSFCYA